MANSISSFAHKAENSGSFSLAGNGDGTFQPAVQISIGEAIEGRSSWVISIMMESWIYFSRDIAVRPIILGNGNVNISAAD